MSGARPMVRRGRWLLWGLLAVASLGGCSSKGPYPVHGKLLYVDGQPITELAGQTIMFSSEELHTMARGEIQADGSFQLTTNSANDGALVGRYKVVLTQPHPEPERPVTGKRVVDLDYEDLQTTPLEVTVEAKTNDVTLKLDRLGKRPKKVVKQT